ncbi:MAG: glutathione S-transferase family protein [Gammaproteobacteria bacterium TMED182]|nr:hypothetical protein [Gammaproteobacteria bacterium]RPG52100.1 MAG: glutathione S-transferase family protein [Gammaproteobacteria bacterium TMED182]
MFTLYGLPSLGRLRQPSPWVMKVELALHALGLEYVLENIPASRIATFGPTGKVPFLVSEGISLNESERIVGAIERYGELKSYPRPADQNDKDGIAFVRLVEDHFYSIICLSKYENRDSSNLMFAELFPNLPTPAIRFIANFAARIIKRRFSGTSIGGLTDAEIAHEAARDIAALSKQLSENGFIASTRLTVYDFTVAAHIAAIFFWPFDNWLTLLLREDRVFREYLERTAYAVGGFEYEISL